VSALGADFTILRIIFAYVYFVFCFMLYYCNMMRWTWWDWSLRTTTSFGVWHWWL